MQLKAGTLQTSHSDVTSTSLDYHVNIAYEEIVKWRRNIFNILKGSTGKDFISEMTQHIVYWNIKSGNHSFALKAFMIMPSLLLQKHDHKAKEVENKAHLKRILDLLKQGKVDNLLFECRSIQDTALPIIRFKASPMPMGRTPGFLFKGIRRQALRAAILCSRD